MRENSRPSEKFLASLFETAIDFSKSRGKPRFLFVLVLLSTFSQHHGRRCLAQRAEPQYAGAPVSRRRENEGSRMVDDDYEDDGGIDRKTSF